MLSHDRNCVRRTILYIVTDAPRCHIYFMNPIMSMHRSFVAWPHGDSTSPNRHTQSAKSLVLLTPFLPTRLSISSITWLSRQTLFWLCVCVCAHTCACVHAWVHVSLHTCVCIAYYWGTDRTKQIHQKYVTVPCWNSLFLSCIWNASLCSKHHITELPLRVGLTHTSYTLSYPMR